MGGKITTLKEEERILVMGLRDIRDQKQEDR